MPIKEANGKDYLSFTKNKNKKNIIFIVKNPIKHTNVFLCCLKEERNTYINKIKKPQLPQHDKKSKGCKGSNNFHTSITPNV